MLSRLYTSSFSFSESRLFSTVSAMQAPKQFAVILRDFKDPDCLIRRMAVRGDHLQVATTNNDNGYLNLGGSILDSHESGKMEGSVLIVTAESKEEIEKQILSDPYYKGKVWEKWEILPLKVAVGKTA